MVASSLPLGFNRRLGLHSDRRRRQQYLKWNHWFPVEVFSLSTTSQFVFSEESLSTLRIPPTLSPFHPHTFVSSNVQGNEQHSYIAPDKASNFLVSSAFVLSLSSSVVPYFHSTTLVCIVAVIACAVLHQILLLSFSSVSSSQTNSATQW